MCKRIVNCFLIGGGLLLFHMECKCRRSHHHHIITLDGAIKNEETNQESIQYELNGIDNLAISDVPEPIQHKLGHTPGPSISVPNVGEVLFSKEDSDAPNALDEVLARLNTEDKDFILRNIDKQDPEAIQMIVDALKLATVAEFLYAYARVHLNTGFLRGSFSIEDKGEHFFKLLLHCAKSLEEYFYERNPTYHQTSHYPDSIQYGVDIVLSRASSPVELLPHGHHILFGSVKKLADRKATFVKCERFGLKTWRDFVSHGIAYLQTKFETPDPIKTHREKDLPIPIVELKSRLAAMDLPISDDPIIKKIRDLEKVYDLVAIIEAIEDKIKKIEADITIEKELIQEDTSFDSLDSTLLLDFYNKAHDLILHQVNKLQGGRSLLPFRSGNECLVPQVATDRLINFLQKDIDTIALKNRLMEPSGKSL